MSLSDTSPGRIWRRFPILALALSSAGCFQPLYGEAAHPGLTAEMRAIRVEPIYNRAPDYQVSSDLPFDKHTATQDRLGHYLGNDLMSNLNGTGETVEPKYKLTVTTNLSSNTPTVSSQLALANAATVTANATYKLISIPGDKLVEAGTATAVTVYDRTEQRFANLRAERDAEIKLAKSLADEIELRLAAKLGEKK